MLNQLFGSEARVKILNLFLLHPEEKYYLRQISDDLKLQTNSLRRELLNLEKIGLVVSEKRKIKPGGKKEMKYFGINTRFLLFQEIKALFVKSQILSSQKFLNGLQKVSELKFLALTGIFTSYEEATTDILLVGKVKKSDFLKLIKALEKDLDKEVNYTIMDEEEFEYRREVADIFLYNILGGKMIVLIDDLKKEE